MPGRVPFTGNIAENKNTWYLPSVNLCSGLGKGNKARNIYKVRQIMVSSRAEIKQRKGKGSVGVRLKFFNTVVR